MTYRHLHGLPRTDRPREPRPARSGEPWSTDDYETLVGRCRAGASLAELAAALERSESAVVARAKRLLPVDQRGAPEDRVIPHLHQLLQEDDDYDWGHHLAATPPPRPVITHLHAPQVCRGIPGLSDRELLAVAGLAFWQGGDPRAKDLRIMLVSELDARDLHGELSARLEQDCAARLDSFRWEGLSLHDQVDRYAEDPRRHERGSFEEPVPFDPDPPEEPGW